MKLQRSINNGIALGVLRDDAGRAFFTTFEDKPIPAGVYQVAFMPAAANPKHGACWEVQNVPGRSDILIHSGNNEADSDGCILIGQGFSPQGRAIIDSRVGYARFLRFLANRTTFTLTIADPA